ncbi:hypothetical protein ACFY5D_13690 [Paeniglutamicibacter sp. NPDC012692]|uniref:hypothetical protein n=1 Tax=Paeniglutamicibacter sp. NPDC012692 TaxID=3364388 RepID=UPI0036ACB487
MTRKTRILASVSMSAALLFSAAIPAQAASVQDSRLVVSAPISQGGSGTTVVTYGASEAFNDWVCRNLGALCR